MIQKKVLSSSDESSEDEHVEDLMDKQKLVQAKANKPTRTSVSAEVYGQFNKKGQFQPKKVNKSEDAIKRIKQRMSQAFMFSALDEHELAIVIDAMEEKKFKAGDFVIKQGDDGDVLYVVDQGQLDCFKVFKKGEPEKHLKVYQPGESFGELALLYNVPRAATIKAKTDAICFSLDRETFNHIVKDAAAKKREKYEEFLSKVELLKDMDPYERLQIADALKVQKFNQNDYIIRQGEQGNTFYFIQKGDCIATKTENGTEKEVYSYKVGDYFGELALIKHEPRAANIVAKSEVIVVYLDSDSFRRLIGPVDEILKRNMGRYEKYVKK
uniref:cAMP-dependent protein kinase regulatory subunit n=1 Tax=Paramecium tetraurelia TaxID=5888 RepID=Q94725_PARTE|nr:44 kDa regulatory subunit of cAMP-dependent protein kinase [Paramecium tetraurelia]